MRNILISIKPQWVEKILNGEKTIEIRKSIPKCNLPCKVYIYCIKGNKELRLFNQKVCESFKIPRTKTYSIAQQKAYTKFIEDESQSLNGKVVAEFTLNEIEKFECSSEAHNTLVFDRKSCLSIQQVRDYCKGQDLYAWHIDNLKIYDEPKELDTFVIDKVALDCGYGNYNIYNKILKRPPQSWCYVEGE